MKKCLLIRSFFLLVSVSALIGCTSKQTKTETRLDRAQWVSRIKFENLKNGSFQSATIDILGERAGSLRLEISAIFGLPVASFVLTPQEFRCAVHQEKVFYTGAPSLNLKSVLNLPINPQILRAIIFELPLKGGDWGCLKNHQGQVTTCSSKTSQLSIDWTRSGENKNVLVQGLDFKLEWFFESPQIKTQFAPNTFQLEPTRGYKLIQL